MAKSARRRAREFALQGLYQFQLAGTPPAEIAQQLAQTEGFGEADQSLFARLLRGSVEEREALLAEITPYLDRPPAALSPVERGILLLAAYELKHCVETPCRVIMNEAIELARAYGGTDGHRYVNAVLAKLAEVVRPSELTPGSRARGR